jgi:hypothetical protein
MSRFNRDKPQENSKRVTGKVTHMADIKENRRQHKAVIFTVTLKHKVFSKTYGTNDSQMATTLTNFFMIGDMVYLNLDENGDIIGAGKL